jgi:hypothetical protein
VAPVTRPPRQFTSDGLAPASGTGTPEPLVLLLVAVAAFLAVIVLGIFGAVRWSTRRGRARRKAAGPPAPGQYVALRPPRAHRGIAAVHLVSKMLTSLY